MISVYKIKDYINLLKSKRRHFYYVKSTMKKLSWYDEIKGRILKPLRALNRVISMLRTYADDDLISIDAYGKYSIQHDIDTVKDGQFDCKLLGGMQ